jgi:serine/threonine-protein kinase
VAGILFALLALGAAAWGAWTYLMPHDVQIPGVVGLSVEEAQAKLEAEDLTVRIAKGEYDEQAPVDQVLSQLPRPGAEIREGSQVVLVPSLGPPPVKVPDLVGMTVPDARRALEQVGLELAEPTERYDTKSPAGRIIDQSVPPKERIPQGSAVQVVVSKGPAPVPVPKVVGDTREAAETVLGANWVVNVEEEYSDDVERGRVISQTPDPKTELQPGETVTIVVSLGPREFELPSFVGMTKDAAIAEIRSLGLIPQAVEFPGAVGELTVASQVPIAGSIVRAGDRITIYVA